MTQPTLIRFTSGVVLVSCLATTLSAQQADPRNQPGAEITLFAPEQHDLYDGRFVLGAGRLHQVGTLQDAPGWDHMGNDGRNLRAVEGTVEIDVGLRKNSRDGYS